VEILNWKEILQRYDYEDPSAIFNRINTKGFIAVPEDYDIINMIVLWKINRTVKIAFETIEYINSIAKAINTPIEALKNTDVQNCFEELLDSPGIRLAMASTIFHFYQPKAFPIIDERAYRQVFSEKLNPNGRWDIYSKYISACNNICILNNIPFDMIDKILYQIDIEKGNKLIGR